MQDETPKAKLVAVFEPCEEGGYHAFIPEIPGIHTQGEAIEETRENLADAIGQHILKRAITDRSSPARRSWTSKLGHSIVVRESVTKSAIAALDGLSTDSG